MNRTLSICLLLACSGCYNAQSILDRVRNDAIRTRLEELELGEFRVTLPRDPHNNEMTEVVLYPFGTSVRYRIEVIEAKLNEHDHIYRQRVLVEVRKLDDRDLADPDLKKVRTVLLESINSVLGDTPLEEIGFYDILLVRH